ncbi:MAG: pseudouridine synthase [Acidimicrobiaceae bacterium]|nr:pseudouridine synthase [Acidimicrobiaceae bacterium]HAB58181.1 pseudouridine synthase [Acidimicrobiaceae bacterium]
MTALDDPDLVLRFWKPYGCLTAFTDRDGRQTLADHIDVPRVYPAGRLDRDSEGLLLLPRNKALRGDVTNAAIGHSRTYLVQVEGSPSGDALHHLATGLDLKDGRTRPATAEFLTTEPALPRRPVPIRVRKSVPDCWIRLTLTEGKNRQVRRMTASVGHPTLRLVRIAIGPITLEGLEPGQWDAITAEERRELREGLRGLRRAANQSGSGQRPPGRRSRS